MSYCCSQSGGIQTRAHELSNILTPPNTFERISNELRSGFASNVDYALVFIINMPKSTPREAEIIYDLYGGFTPKSSDFRVLKGYC